MTSSEIWDEQTAELFDETYVEKFAPDVLTPMVDFLAQLAGSGPALEFAVGTGRVAIPLVERGIPVTGIELSEHMANRLRRKADEAVLPVTIGDMATTTIDGEFSLVYLVANTIANLRTQAEQVACFRNAARHLGPGGRFVIELWVPPLRRMPPGQLNALMLFGPKHVIVDTYELVDQTSTSHHYVTQADGSVRYSAGSFRYVWPSECDLMAELAGMTLECRFEDWTGTPFTSDSERHISVWRKP